MANNRETHDMADDKAKLATGAEPPALSADVMPRGTFREGLAAMPRTMSLVRASLARLSSGRGDVIEKGAFTHTIREPDGTKQSTGEQPTMSDHCKNLELRSTIRKELEEAHARSRNAFDHPEITELRKAVHSDDYTVVEKRLMEKYRELEGETLEAISERWAHAHPDLYRVKGYVVQCAITHLPLFVGDLVTKAELMDEDGELRSMLFLSAACILGPHQGEYLELAQDATADELTP